MAFMMPIVKKNYSIYNNNSNSQPQHGGVKMKSDASHANLERRKSPVKGQVMLRRNAKSESCSFTPSPHPFSPLGRRGSPEVTVPHSTSVPSSRAISIRKKRFSMPTFLSPPHSNRSSFKTNIHPQQPTQSSPVCSMSKEESPRKAKFTTASRSESISSTSSAECESSKTPSQFHSRLLNRLRKTLRIGHKEPEPNSS